MKSTATNIATPSCREEALRCALATTPQDLEQVYRLRYACYRRQGSIEPRPDESFSDTYDALPNHFSFLARTSAEEPVGTVRISIVRPDLGWTTAPCQKVFGDHPSFGRVGVGSFVEASRLCFGPQARRDALMGVVSYLAALADFYETDSVVACPRAEHSPMYQRLFGFAQLAEPRQYFGVNFKTTLLGISRDDLRKHTGGIKSMDRARLIAYGHLTSSPRLTSSLAVL